MRHPTLNSGSLHSGGRRLAGASQAATICAATPCELLELGQEDLRAAAGQQPQLPSIIEAFCTRRLDSAEEMEARGTL